MIKIFSAAVAAMLVVGFIAPVVLKLADIPLSIVVAAGVVLMLRDLWGGLRQKDD